MWQWIKTMQFGNLMFCIAVLLIAFIEGGLGYLGVSNDVRNEVLRYAGLSWFAFSIGGCVALFRLHDTLTSRVSDDSEPGATVRDSPAGHTDSSPSGEFRNST